jgi:dynein heavy chain
VNPNLPDHIEIDEATGEAMSSAIDPTADPKNIEKDILRYYYYIHNGIDTEHVAPLENARIMSVMSLLAERLRNNYPQHLVDLTDEVREDYMLSVKKAIVDFVLRDSKEADAERANVKVPEYRAELDVVPRPWHYSFVRSRQEIAKNLHLINPCIAQLLKLWHVSFK